MGEKAPADVPSLGGYTCNVAITTRPKSKNGEGEMKRWSRLRGHVFEGGCRDADD